jgi:hypothetical protein
MCACLVQQNQPLPLPTSPKSFTFVPPPPLLLSSAVCAAGYGIEYGTVPVLSKIGETRLRKTFTCTQCDAESVPLTAAAGVKITPSGIMMLQEPLVAAAGGPPVPRKEWLPGGAAKRFQLVPGQCVPCPVGSVKSEDGVSCERE